MFEDFFLDRNATDEANAKSLADLHRIPYDSALNAVVWVKARPAMSGSLTFQEVDHMIETNMI